MDLWPGEVVALLGESGCGKSTLGRIILGVEPPTKGEVLWFGQAIKKLTKKQFRKLRPKVQAVFQDPSSSLNPKMRIKEILAEPLQINFNLSKKEKYHRILTTLKQVNLSEEVLEKYPHELSGGMKQRIALARSLLLEPTLLVLDEPTSSLDMSIQKQILELLRDLQKKYPITYFLITHSLPTALYLANRVVVMYLGEIMEIFPRKLFGKTKHHPYTQLLLSVDLRPFKETEVLLSNFSSEIDAYAIVDGGCPFSPRCQEKISLCKTVKPSLHKVAEEHYLSCHRRS